MNKTYNLPRIWSSSNYKNPVAYLNMDILPTNPDPYVIKYNGVYYCYSTDEHGVNISSSTDLANWKYIGKTAKEEGKHDYWAPCVIYDNGRFYLYCSNTGIDTKDNHQEFLQLYTSSSPEGPFLYEKTLFQKFSIDAHVVKDSDGVFYIFYSVNDYMGTDETHPGTSILVDRLIHFTELAGEEKPVVLPTISEEIFEENRFGDGRDWYTVEGAFFLRRHNHAYLIYAANAYLHENYFLGYSISENNDRIPDIHWKKYPSDHIFSPLVRKNNYVNGPGHCSVIQAPNLIDHWIIYHGRPAGTPFIEGAEQRVMYIDPLYFNGPRLTTNAPSYLEQDAPGKPSYFCCQELPSSDFDILEEHSVIRRILKHSFHNYVMEWDISCKVTHMGARYGILAAFLDTGNYLEFLFDSGQRSLSVIQERNYIRKVIDKIPLSKEYNHEAAHNIRILRNFEHFSFLLDGVLLTSPYVHIPYGNVGFITRYTHAGAAHFSITGHTELYAKDLFYLSRVFRPDQTLLYHNGLLDLASKSPVRLTELSEKTNCRRVLECSLLHQLSYLYADIYEGGAKRISLSLKQGNCRITAYPGSGAETVEEWDCPGKDFTIYIAHINKKTTIFLANHTFLFESPASQAQLLCITASRLHITGYEETKLTP